MWFQLSRLFSSDNRRPNIWEELLQYDRKILRASRLPVTSSVVAASGNASISTEEIVLSTLNLSLFICTFICKIGSYIKNGTEVHKVRVSFWAAALTNFRHPLVDLTIIKIVIPFYNAISTIVFESRKSHGLSTLPFHIQRNICHKILLVGTVAAFKNTLSGCWFLYALRRMI